MAYTSDGAAGKAGVTEETVVRYTKLGLVDAEGTGLYTDSDVRRMQVFRVLEQGGLPIEGVAQLMHSGDLSFDFIETAVQQVFAPLTDQTFQEVTDSTGVSLQILAAIRESLGNMSPDPGDLVGEDELRILKLVEYQIELGFRPPAIEQALRVYGESMRRIAETEAGWFRSEIEQPMLQRGQSPDDVGRFAAEFGARLGALSDEAVLAIYHRQQRHAWMQNVVTGMAIGLERAGLFHRERSVPAMCFLDITGYTQLTAERGDDAAADLAEQMKRIVERRAVAEGGRAVKWLGDGVMFYFASPKSAVEAAISMVAAIADAGMAPAHVGVHAGPVVFREGDYYGHTVNLTARIGDFARPGEVLVSQTVVDEVVSDEVVFTEIGPVELKGVGGEQVLYLAVRAEV